MNIKDIKKAGIDDAEEIKIKETKEKNKGKEKNTQEITIKREEESKFKRTKNKIQKFLKQFWHLLWKDDSIKGWIFSILFLFLFIKFIFFPLLSLVTGTVLPLAIVESCSMYHEGNLFSNYENWWERHDDKYDDFDIEKSDFDDFRYKRGLNKGDILFITRARPEKIKLGDIIIFDASQKNPIIHRVIKIKQQEGEYIFSTIGDNNDGQLSAEKQISEDQIVGKAVLRLVPYAGWVKLIFYEPVRPENERGFCHEN